MVWEAGRERRSIRAFPPNHQPLTPQLSTRSFPSALAHRPAPCSNDSMPADANSDSLREAPAPYSPPPETQRLIDELYREELREARAMRPEDKIRAGQELFE